MEKKDNGADLSSDLNGNSVTILMRTIRFDFVFLSYPEKTKDTSGNGNETKDIVPKKRFFWETEEKCDRKSASPFLFWGDTRLIWEIKQRE